jgi:hypothetical protein
MQESRSLPKNHRDQKTFSLALPRSVKELTEGLSHVVISYLISPSPVPTAASWISSTAVDDATQCHVIDVRSGHDGTDSEDGEDLLGGGGGG